MLLVIVTVFCSLISFYNAKQNTITASKENLGARTSECASILENMFAYKYITLEYIADLPDIQSMDWEKQKNSLTGKAQAFGFEHLFTVSKKGIGYYFENDTIRDQSEEPFFDYIMKKERTMTEPFIEADIKRTIITLSVPILDKKDNLLGVLCGTIDLNDINALLQDIKIGAHGYGFLLNQDGKFVAHKDMSMVYHNISVFQSTIDTHVFSPLVGKLNALETGSMTVKAKKNNYVVSYQPLRDTPWLLALCIPEREILKDVNYFAGIQIIISILIGILGIIISSLQKNWTESKKLAYYDSLTGIANRAKCNAILKKLETTKGKSISIINFDLNNLKIANDTYGHSTGDDMIISFSSLLYDTFHPIGFVGRMGCDEFICVVLNQSEQEIQHALQSLQERIDTFNQTQSLPYHLSMSYGYATKKPNSTLMITQLYELADRQMYTYKKNYKAKS